MRYGKALTCSIPVANLADGLAWYESKLGFKTVYRLDDMGWAEVSTHLPGVTVGLGVRVADKGTSNCVLVWEVEDIDASRRELEGKGVKFKGATMTIEGMVRLATFEDLDGNSLMLSQSLQQP